MTSAGSPAASAIGRSLSSALDNEKRSELVPPTGTPARPGPTWRPTTTLTVRRSVAISVPPPFRALATIVSDGVAAADPTLNVRVNGGPVDAGSAWPFTVKTTLATPSAALARASSSSVLFSTTCAPAGLVRLNRPVRKVNVSGAVSADPSAATSALPKASVIASVISVTTTASVGQRVGRREPHDGVAAEEAERACNGVRARCARGTICAVTVAGSTASLKVTRSARPARRPRRCSAGSMA